MNRGFLATARILPAAYALHVAEEASGAPLIRRDVIVCTALAGAVHAGVVARQVYFVGVRRPR